MPNPEDSKIIPFDSAASEPPAPAERRTDDAGSNSAQKTACGGEPGALSGREVPGFRRQFEKPIYFRPGGLGFDRYYDKPGDKAPWLSLCAIMGNEGHHIGRFFEAFEPWVDEIVLVRAIGSQAPDDTFEIASKIATKRIIFAEYVNDPDTAEWPHVDNFARARQMAWDLATGEFKMWADADDVIEPEQAKLLRSAVDLGDFDVLFLPYRIPGSHPLFRERVVRRGVGRWVHAVHEAISFPSAAKGKRRSDIEFFHLPKGGRDGKPKESRSLERNLRILERAAEPAALIYFYLHRDNLLLHKDELALEWGKRAIGTPNLTVAEKYKVYYNLAKMFIGRGDFVQADNFAMNGIRLCPDRRECYAMMACSVIEKKDWPRALTWMQICRAIAPMPVRMRPNWYEDSWYGWRSDLTTAFILRKLGAMEEAQKIEDEGHGGKPILSLLHATRGRPERALGARDQAFMTAIKPENIEHIFAIDADDEESVRELDGFNRVIVEPGGGCVRAWNAAAAVSRGRVLVQMSDDWILPHHWDNQICWGLKDPLEAKKPAERAAVLAISDGHRTDQLLCMAILTREYYLRQRHEKTCEPYLFHPDYLGVFSDNEFTVRAYEAGVIVERRDIVFTHDHPIFRGEALDPTYAAQNSSERYRQGLEVFNRRNPRHKIEIPAGWEAPAESLPLTRPLPES